MFVHYDRPTNRHNWQLANRSHNIERAMFVVDIWRERFIEQNGSYQYVLMHVEDDHELESSYPRNHAFFDTDTIAVLRQVGG